jgi:dTDP-4-amino-4,6-dideoxygalactose transaminase
MPEVSAAYGLAVLAGIETEKEQWETSQSFARDVLRDLSLANITTEYPTFNPYSIAAFPDSSTLDASAAALSSVGIETRKWWPRPVPQMPAFGPHDGPLPVAAEIATTLLGLPMYRGLHPSVYDKIRDLLGPVLE